MASSASVAMTADGASVSWENNKDNQNKLANLFLAHISITDSALSTKWGLDWATVPEEHAAHIDIYGHGANFLVYTYKKSTGKPLELGGVIVVFNGWLYQTQQRLKGSARQATKVSVQVLSVCARALSVCALSVCARSTRFLCSLAMPFDVPCAI